MTCRSRSRGRRSAGQGVGGPADQAATGGTRSSSGINWVTSWRLPPVSVQASGIRSRRRAGGASSPLCPYRPGSGPFRSPLFRLDVAAVDDRAGPLDLDHPHATRQTTARAAAPTHRPAATHPTADNRCSQPRSRAPAADASTQSPSAAQTKSPTAPAGQEADSDPDNATAALLGRNGSTRAHNSSDTTQGDCHRHPLQLKDGCRRLRRQPRGTFILNRALIPDSVRDARPDGCGGGGRRSAVQVDSEDAFGIPLPVAPDLGRCSAGLRQTTDSRLAHGSFHGPS